jgi:hypothetical protein
MILGTRKGVGSGIVAQPSRLHGAGETPAPQVVDLPRRRRPFSLASVLAATLLAAAASPAPADSEHREAPIPAADLAEIKVSDFSDTELRREVPYYLAYFHRVSNSVRMSGADRGFITLPVWRRKQDNRPYNARVLENHVSLAYFYCADRDWNPYHADPAVRERLEALLDFWCRIQNDDGRFSEYGPKKWNLPATGFATMFMGGTLTLLQDGPPIDPALHKRVVAAHKKAIRALLTDESLFRHGVSYSNQYSGLWGGMLAHLTLYPDEELARLMRKRLRESVRDHQSPAGYWYERDGCDWAYTLRTHHSNFSMAWHYARGTDLEEPLVQGETRWAEWLAFNAVPEPDGSGYVLNRAIETRRRGDFEHRENPIAERVPLARAFAPTDVEVRERIAEFRSQLERDWPKVAPLESYSPHLILNLPQYTWYPAEDQRRAAVERLPYLASRNFNRQRCDDRLPQIFTFIRRNPYYAAFNSGKSLSGQQRFGLGLLWTDRYGAVLQSRTASHDAAWGTRLAGKKDVCETELEKPALQVDGTPLEPKPGARDLEPGDVTIAYRLPGGGSKTVTLTQRSINVDVQHDGPFTEQLPLLLSGRAKVQIERGTAKLSDPDPVLEVSFPMDAKARLQELSAVVAGKRLAVLRLETQDTLSYKLVFPLSK